MLTVLWTGLVLTLMLLPASKGGAVRSVSRFFGGTDLTDALGHVIMFAALALLWKWTLARHLPERQATLVTVVITLFLGFSLEFTQLFVSERGSALIDYVANGFGVLLAMLFRTDLRASER